MEAFAHEAGFDAWMTGAVFASLLSIYAHAAAAAASTDNTDTAPSSEHSPFAALAPHMGRINVSRSDFPYIALLGEDAVPDRSHVLVLTRLSPGLRVGAVQGALGRADLGMWGRQRVEKQTRVGIRGLCFCACTCCGWHRLCVSLQDYHSQDKQPDVCVCVCVHIPLLYTSRRCVSTCQIGTYITSQRVRVSSCSMARRTATWSYPVTPQRTRHRPAVPCKPLPRGSSRLSRMPRGTTGARGAPLTKRSL